MAEAKILVVDDEASIRFSLKEMLTRDGYVVVTADDGKTALNLIAGKTFDLVLVDLKLPDINGMDVVAALRQQSPDIVVIVLTAHASLETAVEALRHGAHDYLFKPCKTIELRESIRRGLNNRRQAMQQRKLLRQLEQHLSNSLANLRAATGTDSETQDVIPDQPITEELAEETRFLQRGRLIVDFVRHVITLEDALLELSPTEFNLLAYLISEAPRVIPPQELVREVQGYESEQWEASETVRYHIYRIRQKIRTATEEAGSPHLDDVIRTVRGVGYTVSE